MNKEGVEKTPLEYENLKYAFSIYYIAKRDGKYGVINQENEKIVEFEYISMTYIESGNFIIADKSEVQTVILDSNLAKKTEGVISEINEEKGYIRVYMDDSYKYYNFKLEEKKAQDILTKNTLFLSKKDGKYGYIDKNDKIVIDYIYDDATEQNNYGYCGVKKDGKWGSIDKVGNIVQEIILNLDENIYLNFIGKWYLTNSGLYYTK